MPAPRDYRHIRAWGKMMGSHDYYIKVQQEQAAAEGAPLDALYERDGTWATYGGIQKPDTRAEIDRLLVFK